MDVERRRQGLLSRVVGTAGRGTDDAPARLRALGPLPAPDGRACSPASSGRSCPTSPASGAADGPVSRSTCPRLAEAAAAFLDDRGIEKVTLVGNSMGCAVICEFAHLYPERLERAVLVAPAGVSTTSRCAGRCNRLARDGIREPLGLMQVAVPDYLRFGVPSTLRMFRALTRYPALDRLLEAHIPTLVVLGSADPLMPAPPRVKEVAGQIDNSVLLVVIHGAAHAINFSHPGEPGQRHPAVHVRPADRRRPRLTGPGPRLRDPPRCPPARPEGRAGGRRLGVTQARGLRRRNASASVAWTC